MTSPDLSPRPPGKPARRAAPMVAAPRSLSVRLREWVVRWWAGDTGGMGRIFRTLTAPVEFGFRRGSALRNRMYDGGILPLQRVPVPVISVGNLTVGGSGKTPFSAWLSRELRARGEKPALLARGYGKDEMVLHRRWNPECLVMAEEDRAFGAWKAAKKGASVVVLDDGFQHRRLGRELDIVLVAARTPGAVRLLPRGPFREPLSALARAGVVVVTQKGRSDSSLELEMRLEPFLREPPIRVAFVGQGWKGLDGKAVTAPAGEFLAVCGIGDPHGFTQVLTEATGRPGEILAFPDHHEYTWSDVMEIRERARGRPVVTTEKDGVKLAAFRGELPSTHVLHLGLEFLDGEERLWRHVRSALGGKEGAR